jgi:hypothetical protein
MFSACQSENANFRIRSRGRRSSEIRAIDLVPSCARANNHRRVGDVGPGPVGSEAFFDPAAEATSLTVPPRLPATRARRSPDPGSDD